MLPERVRGPVRAIAVPHPHRGAVPVRDRVVVYTERAGYRDLDEQLDSWLDALYYATVTLSTTGYGDITPVSESARLTNILLVTPLRFLFLIVLIGTTIEVLTERSRQQFRYALWRRRVKKHTVVIGYGMKGRSAVAALKDQGHDADEDRRRRHQRDQHQGGHLRRLRRHPRRRPSRGGAAPGRGAPRQQGHRRHRPGRRLGAGHADRAPAGAARDHRRCGAGGTEHPGAPAVRRRRGHPDRGVRGPAAGSVHPGAGRRRADRGPPGAGRRAADPGTRDHPGRGRAVARPG